MLQSKLFTKTRKEAPKDEVSRNAELLIRAGFIHKDMAGVYSYLPLGLRVLKNIEEIVRQEMNAIGGVEVNLASLQEKKLWEKSGRWSDEIVDNWFKTKLKNETEVGLAFTHEEPLTNLMKDHVRSFRDLPAYVYQFQNKFRNEARAKSGIMRGREFLMKDLYSFSRNEEEHQAFYEKATSAYKKIFERVGIGDMTYLTFASGGSFSKYSHEFQTITNSGEDMIFVDEEKKIAVNQEVMNDEVLKMLQLKKENLKEIKAVEVGNIFNLGTKYSKLLELNYKDENDQLIAVWMGSYGIGIPRLMGTIAEVLADEKGMCWPEAVAPFEYHLILLPDQTGEAKKAADNIYGALTNRMSEERTSVEVLYDDREMSAGAKFADADLIGIPKRIVVGSKNIKDGNVEIYNRKTGETKLVKIEEFL
jgi:prolyl-tRNA synthetase